MKGFFHLSEVQGTKPDIGLLPKCGSCGLFRTCKSPKMPVYGKGLRKVLVVGEAPGQTEDERNRPFVGKAGEYLRQALRRNGIDLDRDCWTTNSLICRPPGNKKPENKEIAYCRPNLLNTIQKLQPQVILTLGHAAILSLLPKFWRDKVGPMEKWAGWNIAVPGFWICPTYHPSYLLRMQNQLMDSIFSKHLEAAFALDEPPAIPEDYTKQVEIIYDDREAFKAIRDIHEAGGWIAFDYETNCLKPEYPKAEIVSCSISNGKRTISYPWQGYAKTATALLLSSPRTKKISSNMKMEARWSKFFLEIDVANWGWDTVIAAHCLDNRHGICGLKFQSFVRLGVLPYNENVHPYLESFRGHYNRIKEIDMDTLLIYNGMDSILEYWLAMLQRKDLGYGE